MNKTRHITSSPPKGYLYAYKGNRRRKDLSLVAPNGKTLLDLYYIGPPKVCPIGSAEQMEKDGFVGIYSLEKIDKTPEISFRSFKFPTR